ncbi:leukocyte elastase inhibitor-like [Ornithodoros turicata]|uniref:leukocyte elastase inhibitor-like n=1 Tax=Ornithodoros turicata TaxID=34597 RepID=UPI0031396ADE
MMGDKAPKKFPLAVASSNALALDLYSRYAYAHPKENLFFSPLGVTSALSMALAGARDTTAEQLIRMMHIDRDLFQTQREMADLFGFLKWDVAGMHIANGVFVRNGYRPSFDYWSGVHRTHGAELHEVDFVENSEMVRRSINTWMNDCSRGQIQEILGPGAVTSASRICLVNGVHFQSQWPKPFFPSDIRQHMFHSSYDATPGFETPDEDDVAVEMVSRIDTFGYVVNKDLSFSAVEVAHKGEKTSLVIVLPNQVHDFCVLEERVNLESLLDVTKGMVMTPDVELCLPRLKLDFGMDLTDTLYYMGLLDLFTDYANLHGMFDMNPGRAYLTEFMHHAVAEMANDSSSDSSSALHSPAGGVPSPRGSIMKKKGSKKRRASVVRTTMPFIVNRPFIFFVLHRELQLILYLGTIKKIA